MPFFKFKGQGTGTTTSTKDTKKKDEPPVDLTPLEKMLQNAGPVRNDGTDKFFGLENFGNTCYCNSIVQALFYSEAFRNHVINYPPISDGADDVRAKVNVTIRPPMNGNATTPAAQGKKGGLASSDSTKRRAGTPATTPTGQLRPEDKPDAPEYKKKQAMMKGPILELSQQSSDGRYGMEECTFTGLKDIFRTLIESQSRTGVLSPQRFLELFKSQNESFQSQMHQDAHEFYGLVLNDVIMNVEANAKRMLSLQQASLEQSVDAAVGASSVAADLDLAVAPSTGWVHDIFEGVLTSETKCLSCETASQRDETFLDLSIDLEEHSSVTSCLGKFSAEEMLCERNKFHCDSCGGLQEAEKRMKIHKLPKVLTFHLKRFKWTEDFSRLQKLFHRVVYPYHLRLFNTTDDAEDPDRLYELYAVVVHIGGNAYHGHYVSVIKTKDRGWLLFDDEMVEPVDKNFVRNFFGDKPGMACAYVLFYQETTFEKMRAEQEAEGFDDLILSNDQAACPVPVPHENGVANGVVNGTALDKLATHPDGEDVPEMPKLKHSHTEPLPATAPPTAEPVPLPPTPLTPGIFTTKADSKTKEERKREKKEAEAAEKARKLMVKQEEKEAEAAEKARKQLAKMEEKRRKEATKSQHKVAEQRQPQEQPQQQATDEEKREKEMGVLGNSVAMLSRGTRNSKPLSRKSFSFLKNRGDNGNGNGGGGGSGTPRTPGTPGIPGDGHGAESPVLTNGDGPRPPGSFKRQISLGLGRKKSGNLLS